MWGQFRWITTGTAYLCFTMSGASEDLIWELGSFESLTRPEASISKKAHTHGWQVGAGCRWKPSVPLHMGRSRGLCECPHNMVAGFPQSKLSKRPRQKLPCTVTYCPSCAMLLVPWGSSGSSCEGTTPGYGYQEARTRGGLSWRLATKQSNRHTVRAQ